VLRLTVDFADLAPAARIRETALALFAEHGPRATSIRMVARAAGISPGAVLHHFPTKGDLEAAVRDAVVSRLRDVLHADDTESSSTLDALRQRRVRADDFMLGDPTIREYVRHAYAEGGEGARALSDEFGRLQADEMDAMVAAGLARPMPDPEVGLLLYRALTTATLLLRPMVEATLGASVDDPAVRQRFRDAELDLLTRPLFPVTDGAA